jgi:NADH:ubiquinone oxidoreductase subunit 6 (subunit J)
VALKFTLAMTSVNKVLQVYSMSQIEDLLASQAGTLQHLGFLPLPGFKIQSLYHPSLSENNEMINIGLLLYTKYGVALIIVGLMLLVSMIGAIVLTLRQTTFVKRQGIGMQLSRYAV